MTIKLSINEASAKLRTANIPNPQLDAEILLALTLDCRREDLVINCDSELNIEEQNIFHNYINRRIKREPIAYITGKKSHYQLEFAVNQNVLIPRPDTEILIDYVVRSPFDKGSILDLCTGSGCIAVNIKAAVPYTRVTASDVSRDALNVAKQNCERLLGQDEIEFIESDMFENISKRYDVIVSNPPYISHHELSKLEKDISDYEPLSALDGGVDGCDYYRIIACDVKDYLLPRGLIAVEIGYGMTDKVVSIFEAQEMRVKDIVKDLASIERVLVFECS